MTDDHGGDQRLTDNEFRSLMDILMCHDDPRSPVDRVPLESLAEKEAVARGREDWIEAYHSFDHAGGGEPEDNSRDAGSGGGDGEEAVCSECGESDCVCDDGRRFVDPDQLTFIAEDDHESPPDAEPGSLFGPNAEFTGSMPVPDGLAALLMSTVPGPLWELGGGGPAVDDLEDVDIDADELAERLDGGPAKACGECGGIGGCVCGDEGPATGEGDFPDNIDEVRLSVSPGEGVTTNIIARDHRGRTVPAMGDDYPGGQDALLEELAAELGWDGADGSAPDPEPRGRPGVHAVDFDGTLTEGDCRYWVDGERESPNEAQIAETNERYHDGWCVIVWTARPWSEAATIEARLTEWGVKHHGILCEKGSADEYVDDKAERPAGNGGGGG